MITCFMHGDYTFEALEKTRADRSRLVVIGTQEAGREVKCLYNLTAVGPWRSSPTFPMSSGPSSPPSS